MPNKELYVSFFQSPSNGMRRAIIWKQIPKHKIELKYYVVEQIELYGLPSDSILGDILLLSEDCVDLVEDWQQYRVGLDTVYECAIDSMKLPKRGSNTILPQEDEAVDEGGFTVVSSTLNYDAMKSNPYLKKK